MADCGGMSASYHEREVQSLRASSCDIGYSFSALCGPSVR